MCKELLHTGRAKIYVKPNGLHGRFLVNRQLIQVNRMACAQCTVPMLHTDVVVIAIKARYTMDFHLYI